MNPTLNKEQVLTYHNGEPITVYEPVEGVPEGYDYKFEENGRYLFGKIGVDFPKGDEASASSISSQDGARQRNKVPCAFAEPRMLPSGEKAVRVKSEPSPSKVTNSL